jgi:hypothetical protein
MNSPLKIIAALALISFAAATARADQTNLVQNLNIQLVGLKQGPSVTNGNIVTTSTQSARVNTSDVINALETAVGTTFSREARLVAVTPLDGGFSSIEVRDGTNKTDVSPFFAHEQIGGSVGAGVLNTRTGRVSSSDFSVQEFVLRDNDFYPSLPIHFDVRGIAVESSSNAPSHGPGSELSADVTGTGDRNGDFLILTGTVTLRGHTLEITTGWTGGT